MWKELKYVVIIYLFFNWNCISKLCHGRMIYICKFFKIYHFDNFLRKLTSLSIKPIFWKVEWEGEKLKGKRTYLIYNLAIWYNWYFFQRYSLTIHLIRNQFSNTNSDHDIIY